MTAATAVTAAPRRRRGAATWIAIGVGVLVVGLVMLALSSSMRWQAHDGLLDPDSPGADGSRALAQVLRQQGIDVLVARDRDAALAALRAAPATLALAETTYLSDADLRRVAGAAADAVLLAPSARDVRVLLGAQSAGYGASDAVPPRCALAAARRAGPIVAGALFTAGTGDGAAGCYPADGGFALVRARLGAAEVTAFDASQLFVNSDLATGGNAALALGLLGRHATVVWYMPDLADSTAVAPPTLGDLTPAWVTPVLVLLACATVLAGVWRGRRFGPLVAESLPVTVRAAETLEGRARLYARSGDAAHALDTLRAGALDRLGALLGLGRAAPAGEVADAAAELIGAPRERVRDILIDTVPADPAGLVAASDRLRDLEVAVHRSIRIERNPDDRA